ncbi:MAG: lytic transglycosylase domain-containing protein [Gammaproteobacteria bacterium]|nr:lytic transglycosylase domain-containing protein [Gammaproteobacteria bacterium]MDE2347010.1 lytic transglycosylase domain-containing protein [Gammaproteobacteria bacterium]
MPRGFRLRTAPALALALVLSAAGRPAGALAADPGTEPALGALLGRILASPECYADKFDAEVWHKSMEPRLRPYVRSYAERIEILDDVYCEAKRDPRLQLPPDLILAMIAVESRFNQFAVSRVGAVGLMQVMPFWPKKLGVANRLVRIGANIRIGCEILRYYLRAEHRDWIRALERYNGSDGHIGYPELVMSRWQRAWRF